MQRSEWLKQMRIKAEALYDHGAPLYWVIWGVNEADNETQREYLQKFLMLVGGPGEILSAACGAGRYDGILCEAGHSVLGIDQSVAMLARARGHFPQENFPRLRYEKLGLQEMDFHTAFDGIICIEAMEHIPREDYPAILCAFHTALKPAGILYFTAETEETAVEDGEDLEVAYASAIAQGLPVAPGEVVDEMDTAYSEAMQQSEIPAEIAHNAVYRFYPALEQVRAWIVQAGLVIVEEGHGSALHHFLVRKEPDMPSSQEDLQELRKQLEKGSIQRAYRTLLAFMMSLRTRFTAKYGENAVSSLYQGYMDMTYFAITPPALKPHNLKVALVFNFDAFRFEIWLSARNRKIQRQYWELFKDSCWPSYQVVAPASGVDAILEYDLAGDIDFSDPVALTSKIENAAGGFMENIARFLAEAPKGE